MSTRFGVGRPAVEELASPQQASPKLHEEAWAGLLKNQGLKISQEVEVIPGCAVSVACPSCPENSPEPPGPGRVIRNKLGWSQLEKTARSGVWLFRSALRGEKLLSSFFGRRLGKERVVPHSVVDPLGFLVYGSYAYGRGPAIGPHTGRRCWPLLEGVLEGHRTPNEAMVC